MRWLILLPALLIAACSDPAPAVFPDLTTPTPQAAAPSQNAEPKGFSPAPGVVLQPAEKDVWDRLTDAQKAIVLEYLKNGATLASALDDEQIKGNSL